MQVRHDVSMLQRAVEVAGERATIPVHHAAAQDYRVRLLAEARRLLAVGCAIAIAAIGLGIGVGLALGWSDTEAKNPSETARIRAAVSRIESGMPPGEAPAGAEPTTNFSIFRSVEPTLFGQTWLIEAGHHFDSSEDESWANAWCYTEKYSDGVWLRMHFSARNAPESDPISPPQTPQTLRAFELTAEQVKQLAGHCPWLESDAL